MTEEQLKRGEEISDQLFELRREKNGWEQADSFSETRLCKTGRYDSSSTYVYVKLNKEQFKLLQYMKLQEIEAQIKELETEFQNL